MSHARLVIVVGAKALLLTLIIALAISGVFAQVMSSSNFQIESQSINFGGGRSTSTNFTQESTIGELATGDSASTNFLLRSGYQQMLESFVSLSDMTDVTLAPALGLAGGTASGTASFVVVTDNRAGYTVTIVAERSPALQSPVGTIPNYTPVGANPDFTFTTGVNQAHFGITVEGRDIAARFRDNGSVCGVGVGTSTNTCFDRVGTTTTEIVRGTSANHPAGATSTVRFMVGIGGAAAVTAGSYAATTTITALTL